MTPAETCYSAFDRELLAVYLAIRHFCHFLEGRHFHRHSTPPGPTGMADTQTTDPQTRALQSKDTILCDMSTGSHYPLNFDVRRGTRNCIQCQRSKVHHILLSSPSPTPSLPDPSDYVSQLCTHMQHIRPRCLVPLKRTVT